ncbi:MAG: DNA translocase FtsK [Planctomycetales bacterium]|nr:DNA translocase FtsK [Planctomycetales bacterium]
MSDQSVKIDHRDLAAYALLFWILFLTIAMVTYDPADAIGPLVAPFDRLYQQDVVVSPPNERVANQCGWWGALTADLAYSTLGVGAYFVLGSLIWVDVQLLRRQSIHGVFMRGMGWGLALLGVTGFANLALPELSLGPVLGSGGAAGALVGWALRAHFATTGGLILCLSAMIAGLMVCTDYVVYRAAGLARDAIVGTVEGGRSMVTRAARRSGQRAEAANDEQPDAEASSGLGNVLEDDEDDDETEVAIRFRGARGSTDDDWQDEDEEEEDEEFEGEEEEYEEEEEDEEVEEEAGEETEIVVKTPSDHKPKRSERELVYAELNESDFEEDDDYELPPLNLLVPGDEVSYEAQRKELGHKARLLEKTFQDFGFNVKVVEIETGPVIAQYEIELEAGLRLSKITNLADDIAIALRVPSVRIVAPIPGKNTVGIEIPNAQRQTVRLRDVIEETNGKAKKMKIPLFLGQDVSGNPMTVDLASLPHLLIAGRTGTGKSVCLNAIITSILMTKRPDEVRMLMIDPKMVELSGYGRLPHLMHPVVTDMKKAEAILAWAVDKMEERYALLARAGVRHITSYNQLGEEELMDRLGAETEEERANVPLHLPFIVIIADEMADLMMTAGKEVEAHIIRLAQKSRAVGIHLILATQKPTVDVITGLIKSNLPARISFQVASRTDSRVVLDEMGAERLLGMGDMLFLWPGTSMLLRGQGTYLGDDEIDRVVDSVSTGEQNFVNELVNMSIADADGDRMEELRKRDELYESAIEVVVREQRGSCSLLQRALGIGYGRAARLIDFMAEDGIVGNYAGSQAREVLISMEDWERMQGLPPSDSGDDGGPKPKPKPKPADDKPSADGANSRHDEDESPRPAPKLKPPAPPVAVAEAEEDEGLIYRADGPSAHAPSLLTAAAAADAPPRRRRKNRIVLKHGDSSDDRQLDDDSAVIDLDELELETLAIAAAATEVDDRESQERIEVADEAMEDELEVEDEDEDYDEAEDEEEDYDEDDGEEEEGYEEEYDEEEEDYDEDDGEEEEEYEEGEEEDEDEYDEDECDGEEDDSDDDGEDEYDDEEEEEDDSDDEADDYEYDEEAYADEYEYEDADD